MITPLKNEELNIMISDIFNGIMIKLLEKMHKNKFQTGHKFLIIYTEYYKLVDPNQEKLMHYLI